jgi:ATP-dependent Clp protease ATP-binding subunit ClpA
MGLDLFRQIEYIEPLLLWLFGRLTDGGRLTVDIDDKNEVKLDITPTPEKDSRASRAEPAEPEEATAG